eukprot:g38179.t1
MTQSIVDSIKKNFEELHSFLYKEESVLLQQLKEEVNQQSHQLQRQIDQIPRDLLSLDGSIKAMEEEINQKDNITFLSNLKETQKRRYFIVLNVTGHSNEQINTWVKNRRPREFQQLLKSNFSDMGDPISTVLMKNGGSSSGRLGITGAKVVDISRL